MQGNVGVLNCYIFDTIYLLGITFILYLLKLSAGNGSSNFLTATISLHSGLTARSSFVHIRSYSFTSSSSDQSRLS